MTSDDDRLARMIEAKDWAGLFGAALDARQASDEGRWCACAEPLVAGRGLMCGRCLLRHQGQYLAGTKAICEAHDFEPDPRCDGILCRRCAMGEADSRHHGVDHPLPPMPWEARP